MKHYDSKAKRALAIYVSIFFLMVMGIIASGYASYHSFEQEFRHQAERQISAIAELKSKGLAGWRSERMGNAEVMRRNTVFAALAQNFFSDPTAVGIKAQLLSRLESTRVSYHYQRVFILDTNGVEKIASPSMPEPVDQRLIAAIAPTLKSGEVVFLDFHQHDDQTIHLSILVPIYTGLDIEKPLGVLVLDIDPVTQIYPLLSQWPIPSETAETLLARRDGEDVLFLNEPRFKQSAPLTQRYPLTEIDLPAVKAALGQVGVVDGVDYRGVPVFADLRSVPDSPWFLISKIDIDEVYAPLRTRLWQTLWIIGMAIFTSGAGLVVAWRQQRILFYRAQAEAAGALRASEEKFRKAFILSPDSININRLQDGMYVSVNNGFTKIMGYAADEVIGKSSLELNIWVDLQDRKRLVDALKKDGAMENLEARFRAKNGDIIYGLMSASILELNGVPHIINITRDITERKRAQESLEKRIVALTMPLENTENIAFNDLFNLEEIQKIQDDFAKATGVASIITQVDGTPITVPSNFCKLCKDVIRTTEKGYLNCLKSDAVLGQLNPNGPVIQPCMSGGLWDAGAGISIGGKHIANWLIGQVRDETQTEEKMLQYARAIGADEQVFLEAFHEVPAMSREKFNQVAQALFTLANQISTMAYQNVQQARFIAERKQADEALRESRALFRSLVESMPQNVFSKDLEGRFTFANQNYCATAGKALADILGKTDFDLHPADLAQQYRIDDLHVIETGQIVEKVEIHQPLGGERFYVQVTKALIYDADGQVKGMLGMFWDITERRRADETLRITLAKYKTLFEHFPLGISVADEAGNILESNPTAEKLLAVSQSEHIQRNIASSEWRTVRSDGTPMPTDEFASVRALKEQRVVENMEMGVLKPDDSVVWLSVTAAPLPEAGQGVVVTYGDITARKQAEDALRESEEKYRNLFNNSEVGMFRVRLDGSEILEFNEKYLKILNYTAEELKGQSSANLWADERERNIMMQLLNAQGYATDFECRMLSKQGDVRKCVMSVRLYRDTEILEGSIQDITERRRIEDSLRESEERYRTVVFHAPVVTFVTDEKGVFTLSEGKGLAKLGLQPGQVVGMSVFDVYRDYPTILNAMKNALAGQHQRDESSVQGIVFDVFYTPVFDQQDKVVKVIGVANDVTERKQSENKIYQLNLELEQRVRARTAQLETTNKELETFSYSVSHDLRAPLRGIDGWSQALLEDYYDQLDGQGRQYIDRVRSETQRMGHLIDDMLQLSRLTRAEMVKEKVDLSALAQVIVERIKRNEPLRQLDFNIHAGLTAEGDTHLLEAALVNLLENAFKFTSKRADARIEFGQMNLQGQRVFFVRDNGAGFDMTYAQKLFGAFQRMHTFSEFPGTGIGLATVQRIIHRHGGRVWAEAEIERGATFYFTLE